MNAGPLLLCLATAKGRAALEALASADVRSRPIVCTFRETHTAGDSDEAILARAEELGCRTYRWHEIRDDLRDFVELNRIRGIVAIGWRYLIDTTVVNALPLKLIVFHDSLLPRHRGFAPLATAILCGDREAGVSVLFATDEVDAGDIILQRTMPLGERDTIAEAIERVSALYRDALADLLAMLESGNPLPRRPQVDADATFSIWRNPEDAEIDWRQHAVAIDRLVRSAGYPYSGAFTFADGRKLIVRETDFDGEVRFSIREPGKVWRIDNGAPVVVCREGMLRIVDAVWEDGSSALPWKKLRVKLGRTAL